MKDMKSFDWSGFLTKLQAIAQKTPQIIAMIEALLKVVNAPMQSVATNCCCPEDAEARCDCLICHLANSLAIAVAQKESCCEVVAKP